MAFNSMSLSAYSTTYNDIQGQNKNKFLHSDTVSPKKCPKNSVRIKPYCEHKILS